MLNVPIPATASAEERSELARQLYFQSDESKLIQRVTAGKKAARASRPLRWVCIANTISVVGIVILASYAPPKMDDLLLRAAVVQGVLTAGVLGDLAVVVRRAAAGEHCGVTAADIILVRRGGSEHERASR